MKLVYAYLDPDVAKWLKENATRPQKGQNYHQWLTSQYGLKILVEHIWMLVGIAKTCSSLEELKHKMERMFGQGEFQYDYPRRSTSGGNKNYSDSVASLTTRTAF